MSNLFGCHLSGTRNMYNTAPKKYAKHVKKTFKKKFGGIETGVTIIAWGTGIKVKQLYPRKKIPN